MKRIDIIRLAGPLIGAVLAVAVAAFIEDATMALMIGAVIFLLCARIADVLWQRRASQEARRRDLEDRVRNPPS